MTERPSVEQMLQNIREIRGQIQRAAPGAQVRLMAVTKTVEPALINAAVESGGITLLGENRVQEFLDKEQQYRRESCQVHFIGHLQTNKVKYIADKVDMIESVDSLKLAQTIQRECERIGRVMPVLVEVNIGREPSKSGVFPEDLQELLEKISRLDRVKVRGLMFIPPICSNNEQKEEIFARIQKLFIDMSAKKIDNVDMDFLSAGMSSDYLTAVKYGANIVRIGTAIFGKRN